jgi:hypothetical protein
MYILFQIRFPSKVISRDGYKPDWLRGKKSISMNFKKIKIKLSRHC